MTKLKVTTAIIWSAMMLAIVNTGLSKPLLLNPIRDYFNGENINSNGDSEIQYVCDLYPKCLISGLICCPMSTQPEIGVEFG